ncbi:hypothetical protein PARPLA_00023 [Rhodobacteraceae bacterium THAF1]|nr:hypothetical protein FIU81_00695 [Palleronia sp. THAF1]VDC16580.1 hypothetical protein PARPLA_00023 [Rhodobacteraceae bacterium THAF1]
MLFLGEVPTPWPPIDTADDIPVTSSTKRLGGKIKRRIDVVGFEQFFKPVAVMPSLLNDVSILRLVGSILMARTEDWTVERGRYLTPETPAPVCVPRDIDLLNQCPACGAAMGSLPAAQRA